MDNKLIELNQMIEKQYDQSNNSKTEQQYIRSSFSFSNDTFKSLPISSTITNNKKVPAIYSYHKPDLSTLLNIDSFFLSTNDD